MLELLLDVLQCQLLWHTRRLLKPPMVPDLDAEHSFRLEILFGVEDHGRAERHDIDRAPADAVRRDCLPLATFDATISPANGRETHITSTEQQPA